MVGPIRALGWDGGSHHHHHCSWVYCRRLKINISVRLGGGEEGRGLVSPNGWEGISHGTNQFPSNPEQFEPKIIKISENQFGGRGRGGVVLTDMPEPQFEPHNYARALASPPQLHPSHSLTPTAMPEPRLDPHSYARATA